MNAFDRQAQIRQYYDCFANCLRHDLTELLVDDFHFRSNFANYDDRESMLDDIWPHVLENKNRVEGLEFFANGERIIAKYRHAGQNGASICELFEFKDEKISSVEVFTTEQEN